MKKMTRLELRWVGPGDDGLRQSIRFPLKHLQWAAALYRAIEPTLKDRDDIELFEIEHDDTVATCDVTETRCRRIEHDG